MTNEINLSYEDAEGKKREVAFSIDAGEIILDNMGITKIDLHQFSAFKSLQEIDLSYNEFHNLELKYLVDCKELETLNLEGNSFQNIDLSPLIKIPHLVYLYLDLEDAPESCLGAKGIKSNIESLRLSILSKTQLLPESFPNLRRLKIFTENSELPNLSSCKNLEEIFLHISAHPETIDLSFLSDCRKLRSLEIGESWLQKIDLSPMSKCSRLENLLIYDSKLKQIDLMPLRNCNELTVLDFSDNCIEAIDLQPLSNCRNLVSLNLFENQLENLDLSPLKNCENLELIDLLMNPLRKLDVTPLLNCKYFRTLQIYKTVVLIVSPEYQNFSLPDGILEHKDAGNLVYAKFEDIPSNEWVTKIILLGESKSGKSTLFNALKKRISISSTEFQNPMSTIGVDTEILTLREQAESFILNVWDFGGQIDFTCIHRLFFTENAVFFFLIKPQQLDKVRFDYWFDMFLSQSKGKGIFVAIRTHTHPENPDELVEEHWTQIKNTLQKNLKMKGEKYNVFPEIFEIDSKFDEGLDNLIKKIPELVKRSGISPISVKSNWWNYLGEVLKIKRNLSENDLGLMTIENLIEKIKPEFEGRLCKEDLFLTISRMHKQGDLIYAPIPNGFDVDGYILLNVDLASRITYKLHSVAQVGEYPGIIQPKMDEKLNSKLFDWSAILRNSPESTTTLDSDDVGRLVDFLSLSKIAIKSNQGVLFPNALHHIPVTMEKIWRSQEGTPTLSVVGEILSSFEEIVSFFISNLQLTPLSVWIDGGILAEEVNSKIEKLYRINIFRNTAMGNINHICKIFVTSSGVDDIDENAEILDKLQQIFKKQSIVASNETTLLTNPVLELTCPECFTQLEFNEIKGISCNRCGYKDKQKIELSYNFYMRTGHSSHETLDLIRAEILHSGKSKENDSARQFIQSLKGMCIWIVWFAFLQMIQGISTNIISDWIGREGFLVQTIWIVVSFGAAILLTALTYYGVIRRFESNYKT